VYATTPPDICDDLRQDCRAKHAPVHGEVEQLAVRSARLNKPHVNDENWVTLPHVREEGGAVDSLGVFVGVAVAPHLQSRAEGAVLEQPPL
jgi:hypothetical protein